MEYFEGIEKKAGVFKKELSPEKFLFFVPEGEKFVFCSNAPDVQKWCESVKTKKVKSKEIKFVVVAAKKALSQKRDQEKTNTEKEIRSFDSSSPKFDPLTIQGWDNNIFNTFNLYCQKAAIKSPECKVTNVSQVKGRQEVSLAMKMEDGMVFNGVGRDKQSAKENAIRQYAAEVLGIDFNDKNDKGREKAFSIDDYYDADTLFDVTEDKEYMDYMEQQKIRQQEKARKIQELKNKARQKADIGEVLSIKKLPTENGRKYQIKTSDGAEYLLNLTYGLTQKKIYNELNPRKPLFTFGKGLREVTINSQNEKKVCELKTVTVSYEKTYNNGKESYSFQASAPNLEVSDSSLDLLLQSNIKMTLKNTKDMDKAEKLQVLKNLINVSGDRLSQPQKINPAALAKTKER